MIGSFVNSSAVMALVTIPSEVRWSYLVGGTIFAIGLVTIFLRGDWQKAQGLDKLILFSPLFYAAPIAAFGTEHFTINKIIASMVPKVVPWHVFWAYFIGACFILAGLSLVTKIQNRLAASLLAFTFFLFVALMDAQGLARNPSNRFALALMLRELSFGAGPLALAASLSDKAREGAEHILIAIARYIIAISVLYYSLEQFLHADHVPGIPLEMVTPGFVFGHSFWTYLTAAVYAVTGVLLLIGKKTRAAATWTGAIILLGIFVVYVPIAFVEHSNLEGLNYFFDTLMFGGTVLLLASALPREQSRSDAHVATAASGAL
jgi:uncharacterized membrane protein YphA (DoxX/SURF4 family)